MSGAELFALSFLLMVACPKIFRKKKRRYRLKRKSKFVVRDNSFKDYKCEPTENIRTKAERCRATQLRAHWPAEEAFATILSELGVAFERQVIIYRRGGYVCLDFLCRERGVAFELDGASHALTKGYDEGRDKWLEAVHSIRTYRFLNAKVFREREDVKRYVRRALGC